MEAIRPCNWKTSGLTATEERSLAGDPSFVESFCKPTSSKTGEYSFCETDHTNIQQMRFSASGQQNNQCGVVKIELFIFNLVSTSWKQIIASPIFR